MVRISWDLGQSQTIEISKIGSNSVNFGPIEKSKVTVISRGEMVLLHWTPLHWIFIGCPIFDYTPPTIQNSISFTGAP